MTKQLPNGGLKWILGCYKIEMTVFPVSGTRSRNIVIENIDGVSGLYHEQLFAELQGDIEVLKATVEEIVSNAQDAHKKLFED